MKQLVEYMKESLATNSPFALNEDRDQTIRLNDFEAIWKVKDPENQKGIFVIEVPEDYTDDDINQYISDLLLESIPSDDNLAKEYFGANADNIIDTDNFIPVYLMQEKGGRHDDDCLKYLSEDDKSAINAICKAMNPNHKDL